MFSGEALQLAVLAGIDGGVELKLDHQAGSVNKIDGLFLRELGQVLDLLEEDRSIRALLISSAKSAFVVGADIFSMPALFSLAPVPQLEWLERTSALFNRLEALPFPSVAAINGGALGGGLELALAADERVLTTSASVGLPETALGICPGWGGSVRLSRLIGLAPALEIIIGARPVPAATAVQLGIAAEAVDASVLRASALALLQQMLSGAVDHQQRRAAKQRPAALEAGCTLAQLKQPFARQLNPHYPAPRLVLETLFEHAQSPFVQALSAEHRTFQALAGTDTARSLIGLFINEQQLKQSAKRYAREGLTVRKGAVLGAGIMGGGIAYQSAVTGTPVLLKDIRQEALELGLSTASRALDKLIEKGRLDQSGKSDCLGLIEPTLSFDAFASADLVVEAVVENEGIKAGVLKETEALLHPQAILTSNTSTISITALARQLQHPERFCGMHFFNPVPQMALVEVIRGEQSSAQAVATAVGYALTMGKTPVVVNDCPGFLVNRVLFPYFNAFNRLLHAGVEFQRIDRVMEAFGWPMGPAYLADVVGLDTMVHADQVLQRGYPQRMGHAGQPIIECLLQQGALGQKNGQGFYDYSQGARNKVVSARAQAVIEVWRGQPPGFEPQPISDQQIIDQMMIPMCLEAFLCLDEGIVGSAAEVDMGLILGLGFPKFRGGALRYIDHCGLDAFARRVDALAELGPLYQLPPALRERCLRGQSFF